MNAAVLLKNYTFVKMTAKAAPNVTSVNEDDEAEDYEAEDYEAEDDDDESEDEDEESEEEKLLRIGNKIISFGKHINKTIKFIYENDIRYAEWCFYKTDRSNNMKYICYYYKKMMNIDD